MSVRLLIGNKFYTVISVYAPTFMCKEEDKDDFYKELREETKHTPDRDVLMIMGDWSARVGTRDETWTGVVGQHGIPDRNDNGLRALETCMANDLRVMNTYYRHKNYGTWQHARAKKWHMIDLIVTVPAGCKPYQERPSDVRCRV